MRSCPTLPYMESWSIDLHKEYFKFSCAHFLIFPDGSKERLHGHNYRVAVQIEGRLDEHGLVMDFNDAKPIVREICDELDEHWLVPRDHPDLRVEAQDDEHTSVVYRQARYLAPSEEIIVLPIGNTSVENLSTWFSRELRKRLEKRVGSGLLRRVRVAIEETSGQHGVHEIVLDD